MSLNPFANSAKSLNRMPHQRIKESHVSSTPSASHSSNTSHLDVIGYELNIEDMQISNTARMSHELGQSSEFWLQDEPSRIKLDPFDFEPGPSSRLDQASTWGNTSFQQNQSQHTMMPDQSAPSTTYHTPSTICTTPLTPLTGGSSNSSFEEYPSNSRQIIELPLYFEPLSGEMHPHLTEVRSCTQNFVSRLESIRQTQREFVEQTLILHQQHAPGGSGSSSRLDSSSWQAEFSNLDNEQKNLKNEMDNILNILYELNQSTILDPSNIHTLYWLHQELNIQLRQLELYWQELQSLLNPNSHHCFAALVITNQPFPEVLTKNKQLGADQLTVKLLSGANTTFLQVSPVQCIFVSDQTVQPKGAAEGPPLQNNIHPVDPETFTASFPVKFLQGSRRCKVTLRFSLDVTMVGNKQQPVVATIESTASNPFIVTTNESQWEGSEHILLKHDVFGGMLEATWQQFCNTLQKHFLRATRQDPIQPKRPLSLDDLSFFHMEFFAAKSSITPTQVDQFWNWFGKTLQVIRFQRYIGALWQQGHVYGCMQREVVDRVLTGQPPGTFVIRFSMKYPGQFAIAYIREDQVKHYLVSPTDTAGAKKTLPDFLQEHPQFSFLLQLASDTSGRPILIRSPKSQALAQFLSVSATPVKTSEDGYEGLS